MKKQVEFFDTDFLDNKIEIGDRVIIEEPKYRNFVIGTVVTKAPKSCQIEYYDFVGDKQVARQYYDQIIKYPMAKEGKWIGKHGHGGYDDYKCSVCGMYEEGTRNPNLLGNYCSYCGALMKDDLGQCGKWEFWDGWIGNHDKRIEDATCSKCGYKHHTVRREFQSNETAQDVLNKLSDFCPGCGIKMLKEKV